MAEPSKPVGFRLSRRNFEKLERRAEELRTTPGGLARQMVIAALNDRTADEIAKLRHDLEVAVVAILADAGKCSVQEAEAFVKARMCQ
jgi:hypothetical protein